MVVGRCDECEEDNGNGPTNKSNVSMGDRGKLAAASGFGEVGVAVGILVVEDFGGGVNKRLVD
jgi:hypothetical protein